MFIWRLLKHQTGFLYISQRLLNTDETGIRTLKTESKNWGTGEVNWVKKLKIDHKNDMQTDFGSEISFIFWKEKNENF